MHKISCLLFTIWYESFVISKSKLFVSGNAEQDIKNVERDIKTRIIFKRDGLNCKKKRIPREFKFKKFSNQRNYEVFY